MKISLVIPAKNESNIIEETLAAAHGYLKTHFPDFELIVADDKSTDDTAYLAEKSKLTRVVYGRGSGKGNAVREGILSASGDYIFFTDADLAYPLSMMQPALAFLKTDTDLVVGNRRLGSDHAYPILRRFTSRCFEIAVSTILGLHVTDTQCGFKGFSKHTAKEIFTRARIDGFSFDAEIFFLASQLGLTITPIPAVMRDQMPSGLSVGTQSLTMMADLFAIRANHLSGKYDAVQSTASDQV